METNTIPYEDQPSVYAQTVAATKLAEAEAKTIVVSQDRKIGKPRSPRYRSVQRNSLRKAARPFARIRSGIATGTTSHFMKWKLEGELKSTLQRAKTAWIASEAEDAKVSAAFAMICRDYKNVWDLSQAKRTDLLAVPGVGPAKLRELHAYLLDKRVKVAWKP